MARPVARMALVACLWMGTAARADFVRGSIKIDVRDGAGKPREAEVAVRGRSANAGEAKVARVGDVYVAAGLIDGDYEVTVGGGGQATVHVQGRMDRGVVFVVGGKRPQVIALGARDVACDPIDGAVVEAVAFARNGTLGAGRIDVRKGGPGVAMAKRGADAVRVLREAGHIRREPQIGAEFLRAHPQQRLQKTLGDEDALGRADVAHAVVQVGDEVGELTAGERIHGHDGAVLHELLARLVTDDLFDPRTPEDLHRPLADLRRARMDRGAPMMLGDDDLDAALGQEQPRGHADEAAADDQNLTFVIHDS